MGTVRWILFAAVLILLVAACRLNWHQKYFNFFVLGLWLLSYVVIVLFWLTCKWQGLPSTASMKEEQALSESKGLAGDA